MPWRSHSCRCVVGRQGSHKQQCKGFSKSTLVHDRTTGTSPFLNLSLKWSQRKSKHRYMATQHWMGTFDYNHWGILEHFSFPPLHRSRSGNCLAASPLSTLERLVRYCITVYFIYLLLHLWRMALFIVVVLLAWRNGSANGKKNEWACCFWDK